LIKIVTDSTCYLPPEILSEHGIYVVPLCLLFDRETYHEGIDIDTEQFFSMLSRSSALPTTSQPNPQSFLSIWHPLLEAGHEIITILLSSRLSSTLDSARATAQALSRSASISVIDSLSIAMGLGMQVLRAAEMAREGFGRAEIVAAVERMREVIHIVLVPDTLEYLLRGGRINTAQAWVGTLLQFKPLLSLQKGIVEPLEKVRTVKRALSRMIERTIAYLGDDEQPWISVMHSRSPGAANELLEVFKARFPKARFFCSEIGPVLGVHLGPRGSGVIACPGSAL
jgi:DegV family protein with EDD domain